MVAMTSMSVRLTITLSYRSDLLWQRWKYLVTHTKVCYFKEVGEEPNQDQDSLLQENSKQVKLYIPTEDYSVKNKKKKNETF